MRPTDEDQPGARRPNLMSSSRRAAGNIHILARLDGVGKARPKRVGLWFGIAGVLAGGLAGAALWMTRTPDAAADPTAIATVVPADVAPPRLATPAFEPLASPPTEPAVAGGATIVNVPDMAGPPAPAPATAPSPSPTIASHPIAGPVQHARPVPDVEPPKFAAYRATPHPAGPGVHAAPGPRRAPSAKAAPLPAPDTDVALISAIIQHAARPDGADDAACGGKPCAERQPGPP